MGKDVVQGIEQRKRRVLNHSPMKRSEFEMATLQ